MKQLTFHELREAYLSFFEEKNHRRVPSASLIPDNDPTTLFTGSGMQPMLPFLLGTKHPLGTRLVDSQKCFRAVDITEVGDNRHTTFFEMLGNWSLGDYFKQEQIEWMFEFLTKKVGLDPNRLYVTAFRGNESIGIPRDTESATIWQKLFGDASISHEIIDDAEKNGLQDGRIFYYDETKNWWSRAGTPQQMPVGEPGGPDTEMFWDFGVDRQIHENSVYKDQVCHVNCDCGRFMEIGNNVFMQYIKKETGFEPLPQKNVDFGGGLERMQAALLDTPDVFQIDIFKDAKNSLENLSGLTYEADGKTTRAFRVILDHLRAAIFLIADGAVPTTKDQGYFTRRLIRRAVRYGNHMGLEKDFTAAIATTFIDAYSPTYLDLKEKKEAIIDALTKEEKKFRETLNVGTRIFDAATNKVGPAEQLPPKVVFDLYQSYGFPFELTQELAQERNIHVDEKSFNESLMQHQQQSRAGSEQKFKGGLADHSEQSVKYHTATHLLHQALRDVLGTHVLQKGSNITPERLRFDFIHTEKMSPEQIKAVEKIINEKIVADLPVTRKEMSVPEAKELGALGLFEHKYGDTVSVYIVGDYSVEICGGPHVTHTGELGKFKITKEESASAGIRRIKAILE